MKQLFTIHFLPSNLQCLTSWQSQRSLRKQGYWLLATDSWTLLILIQLITNSQLFYPKTISLNSIVLNSYYFELFLVSSVRSSKLQILTGVGHDIKFHNIVFSLFNVSFKFVLTPVGPYGLVSRGNYRIWNWFCAGKWVKSWHCPAKRLVLVMGDSYMYILLTK